MIRVDEKTRRRTYGARLEQGSRMVRSWIQSSLLTLGLAAAAPVAAQTLECPPCQTERSMRGLPDGWDAVLVVNNAARQLRSRPGRALASALTGSGFMPETSRAWGELALALDWNREQAF